MEQYPRITVDLGKIRHNIGFLTALCAQHGVSVAAVSKVVCADERIVQVFNDSDAAMLADARTENLLRIHTYKPKLLLRAPAPQEAEEAVLAADISMVSELDTVLALGQAAARLDCRHGVVLLIDLGDLREGIFFRERALILRTARAVCDQSHLTLCGVGTNLTCYGAILPSAENLDALCGLVDDLRRETGEAIPLVSGGNSSTLGLLKAGRVPRGVNHLRLGESILLGNDTAACRVFDGLHGDAFSLSARLIEVQKKPSHPIGESGANAFGERPTFIDEGEQTRGILRIGRQDTNAEGLTPLDARVRILGASSDHLIVDLSKAAGYRVGDVLSFTPDYGALLRAYTSAYVKRGYIG